MVFTLCKEGGLVDEHDLKPPARPAWVVWLVIAAAVLVVTAIALMVLFSGQHSPGRHG
jgi:hypothetical protein